MSDLYSNKQNPDVDKSTLGLMIAITFGIAAYKVYKAGKFYPYEGETINFDKVAKYKKFENLNCSKERILELKKKIFHGGPKHVIGNLVVCLTKNKEKLAKSYGIYLDPYLPYLHFADSKKGFFKLGDYKIEIYLKRSEGKFGNLGRVKIVDEKNNETVRNYYLYTKNVDWCLYYDKDKKQKPRIEECGIPWNLTY